MLNTSLNTISLRSLQLQITVMENGSIWDAVKTHPKVLLCGQGDKN